MVQENAFFPEILVQKETQEIDPTVVGIYNHLFNFRKLAMRFRDGASKITNEIFDQELQEHSQELEGDLQKLFEETALRTIQPNVEYEISSTAPFKDLLLSCDEAIKVVQAYIHNFSDDPCKTDLVFMAKAREERFIKEKMQVELLASDFLQFQKQIESGNAQFLSAKQVLKPVKKDEILKAFPELNKEDISILSSEIVSRPLRSISDDQSVSFSSKKIYALPANKDVHGEMSFIVGRRFFAVRGKENPQEIQYFMVSDHFFARLSNEQIATIFEFPHEKLSFLTQEEQESELMSVMQEIPKELQETPSFLIFLSYLKKLSGELWKEVFQDSFQKQEEATQILARGKEQIRAAAELLARITLTEITICHTPGLENRQEYTSEVIQEMFHVIIGTLHRALFFPQENIQFSDHVATILGIYHQKFLLEMEYDLESSVRLEEKIATPSRSQPVSLLSDKVENAGAYFAEQVDKSKYSDLIGITNGLIQTLFDIGINITSGTPGCLFCGLGAFGGKMMQQSSQSLVGNGSSISVSGVGISGLSGGFGDQFFGSRNGVMTDFLQSQSQNGKIHDFLDQSWDSASGAFQEWQSRFSLHANNLPLFFLAPHAVEMR